METIEKKTLKRQIGLMLFVFVSISSARSQLLYSENFDAPFNPTAMGWGTLNLSSPLPNNTNLSWFQGIGSYFAAFNGGPNDYFACDFNNTGTNGTISSWLITPTLNVYNGLIFQFVTRSRNTQTATVFPDRLQLRLSTAGTNSSIPSGTASVGTFSNLLLDINPNYTSNNLATVNNGTVDGYPFSWSIFTVAITGITGTVASRFAFRYFVEDAGLAGLNSNYVGVDAVKLFKSCQQQTPTISPPTSTVCAGGGAALLPNPVPNSTFSWSTGQTTGPIQVFPTVTTTYTLYAINANGCVGTATTTVFVGPQVANLPSFTICAGNSVTLTANGTLTYSWSTGSTNQSIVVAPNSTSVYTVTGYGAGASCPSNRSSTVTVANQLSMLIAASSTMICPGTNLTLTAISPATSYSWSTGNIVPTITVSPVATTIYSVGGFSGVIPNICAGGNTISIVVSPSPTLVSTFAPTSALCSANPFTISTSGASTYTYFSTKGAVSNSPILSMNSPVVQAPSILNFTVSGTSTAGCVAATTATILVNPNPTITISSLTNTVCVNGKLSITANGATSYTWSGASTANSNPLTFTGTTVGPKQFTATGTNSAGCKGDASYSVDVVACPNSAGISHLQNNLESVSVFPNPFISEFRVEGLKGKIELINSVGQCVFETLVSENHLVETSDFPAGLYFLKVSDTYGRNTSYVKLIKN